MQSVIGSLLVSCGVVAVVVPKWLERKAPGGEQPETAGQQQCNKEPAKEPAQQPPGRPEGRKQSA